MSAAPSTLPEGWSEILDDVQARLDRAIASAQARVQTAATPGVASNLGECTQDLVRWSGRLERLHTFQATTQQVIHAVDAMLQSEETRLGSFQAACAANRQALAEKMGRAIG